MIIRVRWMLALCAICAGCASETKGEAADHDVGTLQLNLTGTDANQQTYRLRNAQFTLAGYPQYGNGGYFTAEVDSESDPTARFLRVRLVPGTYYVTLTNSDWYLERVTSSGSERVDRAVLLSPSQQYVYVYDGGTSDVNFAFGVDGDLIDFRHGNLRIGITIEQPDESDGGIVLPPPDSDAGVCPFC